MKVEENFPYFDKNRSSKTKEIELHSFPSIEKNKEQITITPITTIK